MDTEPKKTLYIPVNVRRRKELVDGFGKKECIQTVITVGIGIVLGFLFYSTTKELMYQILTPIILGMGAVTFLRKDAANQSLIDKIVALIEFLKEQKRYYYQYHNIYEGDREKKNNEKTK